MEDAYKTKDIWVAMCLVALGEQLTRVTYDPIVRKVFFTFDTPQAKGRAIEAVFASKDERLVFPVVKLHEAYEFLHRWRVIVSNTRSELSLKEMYNSLQEVVTQSSGQAPLTIDDALRLLQEGGAQDED